MNKTSPCAQFQEPLSCNDNTETYELGDKLASLVPTLALLERDANPYGACHGCR